MEKNQGEEEALADSTQQSKKFGFPPGSTSDGTPLV
jgi:hypothetical protein